MGGCTWHLPGLEFLSHVFLVPTPTMEVGTRNSFSRGVGAPRGQTKSLRCLTAPARSVIQTQDLPGARAHLFPLGPLHSQAEPTPNFPKWGAFAISLGLSSPNG